MNQAVRIDSAAVSAPSEMRNGWPVLIAAAVAVGCGPTLPLYSLSLFVGPFQAEFGWTRGATGIASTFLTGGLFLAAPVVGRLVDRLSVRMVALPSILLMSLTLASLSQLGRDIRLLYAAFALIGFLGGGATAVCYSRIITLWFRQNRGLALGVMLCGVSVVSAIAPVAVEACIRAIGWRTSWIMLALVVLSVSPIVWLLLREPKSGDPRATAASLEGPQGVAFSGALKTRQFWFLAFSAFCLAVPVGALIVHLVPMLGDRGMSRSEAARVAALIGVGAIVGRLGAGMLVDRVYAPAVAAFILGSAGIGCFALTQSALPRIGVFLVGLCVGSEGDLLAYFTSRYFGLIAFSEIFGWLFAVLTFGMAIGPFVAGALYGRFGGYNEALLLFGGLLLLAALFQGTLGRPQTDAGSANPPPATPPPFTA